MAGLIFSRRAGSTAACSRAAFSTMEVDVSVRIQNFVTTASKCSTSITAIPRIQLSSPVTFQALTTSGVCSISLTTGADAVAQALVVHHGTVALDHPIEFQLANPLSHRGLAQVHAAAEFCHGDAR